MLFLQDVGFQNKRKIFILFIGEEFKVSNLNVKKEDLNKMSIIITKRMKTIVIHGITLLEYINWI